MFDLKRHKPFITECFIKHFRSCKKPTLAELFINRWSSLLSEYSNNPKFSCFDTPIPLIENLPMNPKAVLVIPNKDTKPKFHLSHTTLFPLCPFRVYLNDGNILFCKEGVELLRLYLEITRIKLVGFYRVKNHKFVLEHLDVLKDVNFYTPNLFIYFCRMTKGHDGSVSKFQKTCRLSSKNERFRSRSKKPFRPH